MDNITYQELYSMYKLNQHAIDEQVKKMHINNVLNTNEQANLNKLNKYRDNILNLFLNKINDETF